MTRLADAVRQRLTTSWWRPQPDVLANALRPLAALYGHEVARRRKVTPRAVGVPVVVVGNLIVGGAGKTPTVIAVVAALRDAGWTPGIISRGYGRRDDRVQPVEATTPATACGDEPLLLHLRTRAPVVVGRDRVAAAHALRERHPQVDVIVSDDGLQHWRLARDVQVVVFDARGAGNGQLLPAGPLREPLPPALPPATLVLYNADALSTPLPGWTARRGLAGIVPLADWWAGAPPRPIDALRGSRVVAAAGIADPARFFTMLQAHGLDVEPLPLPDHHDFATLPWPADTRDVVLTEKDAVKLPPERLGATRVWVAALDFQPDPAFSAALRRLLPTR